MTLTEVVRLLEADKIAVQARIAMHSLVSDNPIPWGAIVMLWGIAIEIDRVLYWLHLVLTSGEGDDGKV